MINREKKNHILFRLKVCPLDMINLLLQYLARAEMANNQGRVLQLTIYFLDIFKIIT